MKTCLILLLASFGFSCQLKKSDIILYFGNTECHIQISKSKTDSTLLTSHRIGGFKICKDSLIKSISVEDQNAIINNYHKYRNNVVYSRPFKFYKNLDNKNLKLSFSKCDKQYDSIMETFNNWTLYREIELDNYQLRKESLENDEKCHYWDEIKKKSLKPNKTLKDLPNGLGTLSDTIINDTLKLTFIDSNFKIKWYAHSSPKNDLIRAAFIDNVSSSILTSTYGIKPADKVLITKIKSLRNNFTSKCRSIFNLPTNSMCSEVDCINYIFKNELIGKSVKNKNSLAP